LKFKVLPFLFDIVGALFYIIFNMSLIRIIKDKKLLRSLSEGPTLAPSSPTNFDPRPGDLPMFHENKKFIKRKQAAPSSYILSLRTTIENQLKLPQIDMEISNGFTLDSYLAMQKYQFINQKMQELLKQKRAILIANSDLYNELYTVLIIIRSRKN
jgi:hypothetical protein